MSRIKETFLRLLILSVLLFGTQMPVPISAQASIVASNELERRYMNTEGHPVLANTPLTGNYAWSLWLRNSGEVTVTKPSISILTQHSISLFEADPVPIVVREGASYRFIWNFTDVPAQERSDNAYLNSPFKGNFTSGCNSARIISPLEIEASHDTQKVTVSVSPQKSLEWLWVEISWWDETRTRSSILTYSPMKGDPGIEDFWIGPSYIGWGAPPSGSYDFSVVLSVTNSIYPGKALHKARVLVGCVELVKSTEGSSGSSMQAVDPLLGVITYSAQRSYSWTYTTTVATIVTYPEQEAFLHVENVSLASTTKEPILAVTGANQTLTETQPSSVVDQNTMMILGSVFVGAIVILVLRRRKRIPEDRTQVYE